MYFNHLEGKKERERVDFKNKPQAICPTILD